MISSKQLPQAQLRVCKFSTVAKQYQLNFRNGDCTELAATLARKLGADLLDLAILPACKHCAADSRFIC
jgi:hypothetical protein